MTSSNFSADPWFADTEAGSGCWCEAGAGEVDGFSITVPNWAKEVRVRSSIGMRIVGAGIEGAILQRNPYGAVVGAWRKVERSEDDWELWELGNCGERGNAPRSGVWEARLDGV